MPQPDFNGGLDGRNQHLNELGKGSVCDEDLLMEQILENINNSPLGQVLKKIAMLPEVRQQKVLKVRRQLTEGNYNLNERLDIALDKILEELTT